MSEMNRFCTELLGEFQSSRIEVRAEHPRAVGSQQLHREETPAFVAAEPEVSVLVTLYNYEHLVTDTLESILASTDVSLEIIVVEDHATDGSRDVVRRFMAQHPDAPMCLLAKDANEGLAAARNTGLEHCRADLVMMMDADNLVYPTCLRRPAEPLPAPAVIRR